MTMQFAMSAPDLGVAAWVRFGRTPHARPDADRPQSATPDSVRAHSGAVASNPQADTPASGRSARHPSPVIDVAPRRVDSARNERAVTLGARRLSEPAAPRELIYTLAPHRTTRIQHERSIPGQFIDLRA